MNAPIFIFANRMSEVEKEVSVEKEKLNEPAEVKKEEEKPAAAELPS